MSDDTENDKAGTLSLGEGGTSAAPGGDKDGERIAKALARAGVGSRRDVERMITEGRISLDGKKLETPAVLVTSLAGIKVDGAPVAVADEVKIWRFHKPRGVLTTHKDPQGRPTVFEKLPAHLGRVVSVGRLDMNTEGLLLLTNDGELARYLELPTHEFIRRYRVRVYGTVDQKKLEGLIDGATIDGVHYGPVEAAIESVAGAEPGTQRAANTWVTVAIREGKNREVRRLMEHLGLTVNRLVRTHYGPFVLGPLAMGAVDRVSGARLRSALPDYFKDRQVSAAMPEEAQANPKKWARAKPKNDRGVKKRAGQKRRARAEVKAEKASAPKAAPEKADTEKDAKPQAKRTPNKRPTGRSDSARGRSRPPGRGPVKRG